MTMKDTVKLNYTSFGKIKNIEKDKKAKKGAPHKTSKAGIGRYPLYEDMEIRFLVKDT